MLLQVAGQLLTVVADVSLVCMPLTCMLSIGINALHLAVSLLFNPSLIETYDASFELLIVGDVLDDIKDIIFEPILEHNLHVNFMTAVQVFVLEALVAHLEIIDDQVQIVADALEVLHFDLHLVDLFVE